MFEEKTNALILIENYLYRLAVKKPHFVSEKYLEEMHCPHSEKQRKF